MAEVRIDADEWWPVYSVSEDYGFRVQVQAVALKRWVKAERDFAKAQAEMEELYKQAQAAQIQRA